jgi:hypothetical protein
MAAGESMSTFPFNWGDSVRIINVALAAICGYSVASVRFVGQESTGTDLELSQETALVLIELPDGRSLKVPGDKLVAMSE